MICAEPLVPHVFDVPRWIVRGSLRPCGAAFQADDGHRRDVVVGRRGDREVTAATEWAGAQVRVHARSVARAARGARLGELTGGDRTDRRRIHRIRQCRGAGGPLRSLGRFAATVILYAKQWEIDGSCDRPRPSTVIGVPSGSAKGTSATIQQADLSPMNGAQRYRLTLGARPMCRVAAPRRPGDPPESRSAQR